MKQYVNTIQKINFLRSLNKSNKQKDWKPSIYS